MNDNQVAIKLLDKWMADESGDQEKAWSCIKERLMDSYGIGEATEEEFWWLQEIALKLAAEVGQLKTDNAIMKEALVQISVRWMIGSAVEAACIADKALEKIECQITQESVSE